MKTLKETKKIKMIVAILVVLIIGVAIVGICTNNATMASEETTGEETCQHEQYVVNYDETNHWEECSVCGEVKADSTVAHTYVEGVCTCGAQETTEGGDEEIEVCAHEEYVVNYDETNHWEECAVCGEVKADSTVAHTYVEGVCTCGAQETTEGGGGETETCTHEEYVVEYDTTNHWEECSSCGTVKVDSTVAHTYVDGVCECGAEELCEHEFWRENDETHHWDICSKCNEVKEGTFEEHTYEEYIDNKDGTHTASCMECSYELTEDHDTSEECVECGYTTPTQGEGNDEPKEDENKDDNKVDNTVVDKEIPHTGAKNIALVIIFALGIAGAISAVKMRKYKGI